MRGYVTFILVFFAVILLLLSLEALTYSDKTNLSQAISFSRVSKIDLNAKDAIIELAREGARDGLNKYIQEQEEKAIAITVATRKPTKPNYKEKEAEDAVNLAVYLKIMSIKNVNFADSVEVKFWCNNYVPSSFSILKDSMLRSNSALICSSCSNLDFCSNMIISKVDVSTGYPILESVQLTDSTRQGIIGISVFDKAYRVVSIGYVPSNYKITG
ncbi:MAG: hypothetical protein AABX38_02745 [Candidatus Micrarchaeota archaeon]